MINISGILMENGINMLRAHKLECAFNKKYGNDGLVLVADLVERGKAFDFLMVRFDDLERFDIVRREFNEVQFGEFPQWIQPVKVEYVDKFDYTGWKQKEFRGTFIFEGKKVEGTFISHFHVDRQSEGLEIESIFWSDNGQ